MSKKQQPQQPREINDPANMFSVVFELWRRASPGLSKKELEWFRQGCDTAQASLRNFAGIFEAIASGKKSGLLGNDEAVSRMFFAFSDYTRYLEVMFFIAAFADEQLHDSP